MDDSIRPSRPLPSEDTLVDVDRLPQMDILLLQGRLQDKVDLVVHQVYTLEEKLNQLEEIKIKEFAEKDVYEVNKRIKRLERKIALLESNSQENRLILLVRLTMINVLVITISLGIKMIL
jgi:uncharacterized protein YlzI (FlbEa/FlbD family)